MLPRGIERDQWHEMGRQKTFVCLVMTKLLIDYQFGQILDSK